MTIIAPPQPEALEPAPERQGLRDGGRRRGVAGDHLFRWLALLGGLMVLVVLGLIAYSTTTKAMPWFRKEGLGAVFSNNWDPAHHHFGALALVYGTFLVGALALLMAVPVSIGIALFVTEVAPRRLSRPVIYVVDLLAAIPSVVYGLWAIFVLLDPLANLFSDVSSATSDIPILKTLFANPSATGRSYMTAGIIVAIMITPIITSITREVFATTPASLKEAAYGLGSTKWEMIRGAVFPHSRGGVVSAVMIGLGRAIGETIAVALVIGASQNISLHLLGPGDTMASAIVLQFGEASGTYRSALIGLGVVLFALTILVGMVARTVVARVDRKTGAVA
jgi:phosphate transport system permease protein